MVWTRGQQTFPEKGPIVNILGFVGHMIFVATIQLSHRGVEATMDHTYVN